MAAPQKVHAAMAAERRWQRGDFVQSTSSFAAKNLRNISWVEKLRRKGEVKTKRKGQQELIAVYSTPKTIMISPQKVHAAIAAEQRWQRLVMSKKL